MAAWIYRCQICGATVRVDFASYVTNPFDESSVRRLYPGRGKIYGSPPEDEVPEHCGFRMRGRRLKFIETEHDSMECNVRCRTAVGHTCSCSCGGANHGIAHAAGVDG